MGFDVGLCHHNACLIAGLLRVDPLCRASLFLPCLCAAQRLRQPHARSRTCARSRVPNLAPRAVERPFPDDSVYPLLVAEFALRRRAYDVALENTWRRRQLADAGVSAHTTHLTQFMQQRAEALEAAQLWVELDPENMEANNTLATCWCARAHCGSPAAPGRGRTRRASQARFPALLNGFRHLDEQQRAELVQGINELARSSRKTPS